jgi:hypothetical protein
MDCRPTSGRRRVARSIPLLVPPDPSTAGCVGGVIVRAFARVVCTADVPGRPTGSDELDDPERRR